MSFDLPRPALIAHLGVGTSGDYDTAAKAFADSASWTVLEIGLGTFVVPQGTLPAGKCIEGLDKDRSILQFSHNVLDEPCLSVGNQSTLRNFFLRAGGTPGALNRVHLIDFGAAIAGQYVVLDNMRVDNGGGVQPYRIDAPVRASNCWFDIYTDAPGFMGVTATETTGQNCWFRKMSNDAQNMFLYGTGYTFDTCTFERVGADAEWFSTWGTMVVRLATCTFIQPTRIAEFVQGTLYISGSDLGAGTLWLRNAVSTLYAQGNTNYGAITVTTTAVFKQIDPGLYRNVIASPAVLYGWENYVYVANAAATAITMPACANFGPPYLVVYDQGGNADRYPITLTCAGTDVFATSGLTTYVINEKYGYAMFQKDEAANPDQWVLCGSSRPSKPDFQGNVQVMGAVQKGNVVSDGTVSLKGEGLLGLVSSVAPALVPGVDAQGQFLQFQTSGAIDDRAYTFVGNNTGPLSAAANWDLTFRFLITAQSNDIRFALGACASGVATSTLIDGNDPNASCCAVIKESGSTQAKLWVKLQTGGAAGDVMNFPTWTPLANTYYSVIIRKRGVDFTAIVYDAAGAVLDSAVVSELILATADLRVSCGLRDTGGAAGRHVNIYGIESRQIPSTRLDI